MQADRTLTIDQVYDLIDTPYGVSCLFPQKGDASIAAIAAEYGDDLDVVCQSATWFLRHSGDGKYFPLENADRKPFIGSQYGIFQVRTGYLFEDPNGDALIATPEGWKPVEIGDLDTYGAMI